MNAMIERFPSSFEVFEYYAHLANRAAQIMGIPGLADVLEFLRERVDPADLPPGSHLRQRLIQAHLLDGLRESK